VRKREGGNGKETLSVSLLPFKDIGAIRFSYLQVEILVDNGE
jgi:hypothetical protein